MACHLTFAPRVDAATVKDLCDAWRPQILDQAEVEIDCSTLEFFGAAAAQVIVAVEMALCATGGSLVLKNVPEAVRDDFALLGMSHYLKELAHHV